MIIDADMRHEVSRKALSYYGLPYKYGGKDPWVAMDCSGFTQTVYAEYGRIRPIKEGCMSVSMQLTFYRRRGCEVTKPYEGCLVFYRRRVGKRWSWHVMYCVDEKYCVGASGDMVCVHNIKYRPDIVAYVDPLKGVTWE